MVLFEDFAFSSDGSTAVGAKGNSGFISVLVYRIRGCKMSRILLVTFFHTSSLLLTVSFSIMLFRHKSFNLGYIVLMYFEISIRISLGQCWTNDDIIDFRAT